MTDLVPRTRLSWAGSRLVVLGVVAAGTLFGLAAPPVFADSSQPIITHPGDDFAGSQIARHEGRRDVQDIPLDPLGPAGSVPGMDVSGHQGAVDWGTAARNGAQFAYVKATEGIPYTNPYLT